MEITIQGAVLIFTTITTLVGSIWAWFESKKNKKLNSKLLEKEVESDGLAVVQKNVSLYQDMIDDMRVRFEVQLEDYKNDIERLKLLIEESREVIGRQEEFLKEKTQTINRYESIMRQHKIRFDENSK